MKQEATARMDEQQRKQLFELWRGGASFPEIASTVNGFMQDAATRRASGASEAVERGDDAGIYSGWSRDTCPKV